MGTQMQGSAGRVLRSGVASSSTMRPGIAPVLCAPSMAYVCCFVMCLSLGVRHSASGSAACALCKQMQFHFACWRDGARECVAHLVHPRLTSLAKQFLFS